MLPVVGFCFSSNHRFCGWGESLGVRKRQLAIQLRHGIYYCICQGPKEQPMQRKAKIFMNNRSQAVRLPKEFQFRTREVFIRKEGSDVVLSPRPFDWTAYLAESPVASSSFMEEVEDLAVQEREA
jgi:antitoxin VapB